ncbi:hypothetical protein KAW38_01385 [Candidatus Micrarchaeota archaeon]|nr:hypothetical protein [Candidatus Micrarchaeota archaeon]
MGSKTRRRPKRSRRKPRKKTNKRLIQVPKKQHLQKVPKKRINIPAFVKALIDKDCEVRESAVWDLSSAAENAINISFAVPIFMNMISDKNKEVRHGVRQALKSAAVNEKTRKLVLFLLSKKLLEEDPKVREEVTKILGSIAHDGVDISPAVSELGKYFNTRWIRRSTVILSLLALENAARAGTDISKAVPDIIRAGARTVGGQYSDLGDYEMTAKVLSVFESALKNEKTKKKVVNAISGQLSDEDWKVRFFSTTVLFIYVSKESVPPVILPKKTISKLKDLFKNDKNTDVRKNAKEVLNTLEK